jgi:Zn-finger protein
MRQLVVEKYSLVKTLEKLFPGRHYQAGQRCYCPFHDNTDTPAAAIYDDEKGETLWCFTEKRLYTVVDVLDQFLHRDVYELAEGLWVKMSEEEKALWIQNHPDYSVSAADFEETDEEDSKENKELEKAKELYKNKKISLNELLVAYIK